MAATENSPLHVSMYISEHRKSIATFLYQLAFDLTASPSHAVFKNVPIRNSVVRHLLAGAQIRQIRSPELFMVPNPKIVEQLIPINTYWPALLAEELEGELDTGSWLKRFIRHFVRTQLAGLADPKAIGVMLRHYESQRWREIDC